MEKKSKPLLVNDANNNVVVKDFYDPLVEGDGRENASSCVLEGYDAVTVRPRGQHAIDPVAYAQLARNMGVFPQVQLWAGEGQFLPLLPCQFEDLEGIVVSEDQNNRFSATLVPRRKTDYPHRFLRYWFPFLEAFWVQERIDDIRRSTQGEQLIFRPSNNPDPVPEA